MISSFFKRELSSTKWDRMNIDDILLFKINKIKEDEVSPRSIKIPLGIQSTVYPK